MAVEIAPLTPRMEDSTEGDETSQPNSTADCEVVRVDKNINIKTTTSLLPTTRAPACQTNSGSKEHPVGTQAGRIPARQQADGMSYRSDIDGLRALAVTAVIIYHMKRAWLPGGFTGVDMFFVISGFVVSGSLLLRSSPSVGSFLAGFYARRIKRLSPALVFAMLATSLGAAMLIPPQSQAMNSA